MQEFIDFVASQPPEQRINHHSWHSCAIGEYADSIDQLPSRDDEHINPRRWGSQMKICIDSLRELRIPNTDKLTMYDVLCDGYTRINPKVGVHHNIETYGGLHDLVKWCIKEQ